MAGDIEQHAAPEHRRDSIHGMPLHAAWRSVCTDAATVAVVQVAAAGKMAQRVDMRAYVAAQANASEAELTPSASHNRRAS